MIAWRGSEGVFCGGLPSRAGGENLTCWLSEDDARFDEPPGLCRGGRRGEELFDGDEAASTEALEEEGVGVCVVGASPLTSGDGESNALISIPATPPPALE